MNGKRKALGRGLSSLIPEPPPERLEGLRMVDLDRIIPNHLQPRRGFKDLEGLAASIKENGIIQPIVVTEADGTYQIVAGERRWRAARMAGISRIPVILRNISDDRRLEMALVENIQRQELNPLEEAKAYDLLISELQLTQEEVARRVGKDRSTVSNHLRILKLPEKVQEMIAAGHLDGGHAKALVSLPDAASQIEVAEKVASRMLSVRETEELVRLRLAGHKQGKSGQVVRDPNVLSAEERLTRSLGTRVRIASGKKKGTGKIEIDYYSDDELDRLFSLLVARSH